MRIVLLSIVLAIITCTANAQDFNLNPTSKTIDITFNAPKGTKTWSNPYIRNFDIEVNNELNATLTVNIDPSTNDGSFIRVTSSRSTLTIPPLSSDSVLITVKIIDSAANGGSYSGRVRLTSGSRSENVNVLVKTRWPPPTLGLSGNINFGEVTTGKSYTRSFTLREELRFYDARNVGIRLRANGPIDTVTTSPTSFPLIDGQGRTVTFGFTVKERGVVPGTYRPDIGVTSSNGAELIDDNLVYTIPRPIIEVSDQQDKIIFDYGRPGTSDQEITITETGGKTPVENIIISFTALRKEVRGIREEYGQTTWFTFPKKVDYLPPGGSESIHIKVMKPEEAPVGNYLWEGEVRTTYAGDEPFQISFAVIPPGVRELLSDVRNFENDPAITGHPAMETVRITTESLLRKEFFENGMADVENITLLTNTAIKFLNSMSAAYGHYEKNSYNAAYEGLMTGKEEFDRMDSIRLIEKYHRESSEITHFAHNGWTEFALVLIGGLEANATESENLSNPDASYYESRNVHEKMKDICSLLNDSGCVQAQNNDIMELNGIIQQLIAEAHELELQVNRIHRDIQNNTWSLFGTRVIRNPLRFVTVWEHYNEMVETYDAISIKYQLSGELIEREKTQEKLAVMKQEAFWYKFINSMYVSLSVFVLILTIWNAVKGALRYQADNKDMRLSEIVRLERSV
ncbi:MAG: hypothetical protein M8353_00900 [ANME-2 cluster archaeon]|nr:hypothetical protein [ANME-2 cluster archaeon]